MHWDIIAYDKNKCSHWDSITNDKPVVVQSIWCTDYDKNSCAMQWN